MKTYREFRPTAYDTAGLGLEDRQDWIVVPCSQTRDSGSYERSNFEVAQRMLRQIQGSYEVHRFGHWGPGWFKIILVHPAFAASVKRIADKLENYPILDDAHHSEMQFKEALDSWRRAPLRERVQLSKRFGFHLMAARHSEIPEDRSG